MSEVDLKNELNAKRNATRESFDRFAQKVESTDASIRKTESVLVLSSKEELRTAIKTRLREIKEWEEKLKFWKREVKDDLALLKRKTSDAKECISQSENSMERTLALQGDYGEASSNYNEVVKECIKARLEEKNDFETSTDFQADLKRVQGKLEAARGRIQVLSTKQVDKDLEEVLELIEDLDLMQVLDLRPEEPPAVSGNTTAPTRSTRPHEGVENQPSASNGSTAGLGNTNRTPPPPPRLPPGLKSFPA